DITKLDEGEVHIRKALELDPYHAASHSVLAMIRHRQGMLDETIVEARRAMELDPHNPGFHSNLLLYLHYTDAVSPEEVFQEHRRWAERYARGPASTLPKLSATARKLRIGYVSADFRGQSVSHFMESVLANHDKTRFEIFCYSSTHQGDKVTARLKKYADGWR